MPRKYVRRNPRPRSRVTKEFSRAVRGWCIWHNVSMKKLTILAGFPPGGSHIQAHRWITKRQVISTEKAIAKRLRIMAKIIGYEGRVFENE